MNILFLSRLSSNNNCGPYYSVPRQVAAQKEIDNVLWINANENCFDDWVQWADVKTERDFPNPRLAHLPAPFNRPDIVVVEEQYNFVNMPLMRDVQAAKIPYILVPRCSLTASAQKKKAIKKRLGNFLYFNRFMKNAAGIQYLTEQEKAESGERWNKNGFVIPNGITMPEIEKTYHNNRIECVFIGRIDIYHKGLDMLLAVCSELADAMKEAGMHLTIYGAGNTQDVETVKKMIEMHGNDVVDYCGPVHGKEKEKVLLNADAFILTSRFEGMPMGLLEAMSYGIPVIITEGTNMVSVVEKYNCGWTCDTTETAIKSLIQTVIKEQDQIPSKGRQGRIAANTFDWSSIALETHKVLENIIQSR